MKQIDKDRLNRRDFIKGGTLGLAGLILAFPLPSKRSCGKDIETAEFPLNAYLRIGVNNDIHIVLPKVEMGQGISTTLPMLIAEELDCDWKKIKIEHAPPGGAADFDKISLTWFTGGSESTASEFDRCREAGAQARAMLVSAAAKRFGVENKNCITNNGYVISGNRRVSYGDLALEASKLTPSDFSLKNPKDWKLIGKSVKRLDAPDKVSGKTKYGIDIDFPGLHIALVAHPPVFGGTVKRYDDSKTKALKGVKKVVKIATGIAVVANSFWAAKKGRDLLEIDWDLPSESLVTTDRQFAEYQKLASSKGSTFYQKGDVQNALKNTDLIDAAFSFPYLAHAPMEPLNCTVNIGDEQCDVWVATQSARLHQAEIARFLGLKPEQVKLYTPAMGGSFGRRGSFAGDWVMEAVQVAKESGLPVKMIWTREDDIKGGYYRPMYVHRVQIGIDKAGYPTAWQHRIVGQSQFRGTPLKDIVIFDGIDYSSVTTGKPYTETIPHYSFELHTTEVVVPVLPWRSVGATHNVFVMETLIDELATKASIDPVVYRRKLLQKAPRHLAALNLAAEKSGWSIAPAPGTFRGIAVCEAMGSYVAQVVEISVENNEIKVLRVVCAIDCGLAVNPDGVVAQMEGGIVFGLSAALFGEITLVNGEVQQNNFHDYRILRMNETPKMEIHIVPSSSKMGGAGEPGVAPIAPALANAIFAATGQRLRNLPLRLV